MSDYSGLVYGEPGPQNKPEEVFPVEGPQGEIHEVARQLTPEEAYLVSIFGIVDGEIPTVPPMLSYTKKPIRIWAWKFDQYNGPLIANWVNQNTPTPEGETAAEWFPEEAPWQNPEGTEGHDGEPQRLTIHTLEGIMYANLGDFIVKGIEGEFYPVKPNIFNATYELTGEPPANPS